MKGFAFCCGANQKSLQEEGSIPPISPHKPPPYEPLVESTPRDKGDDQQCAKPSPCAVCCVVILVLLCIFLLCLRSPPLPTGVTTVGAKPNATTTFFFPAKAAEVMPLAPAHYPENLQGMMWLDTFGAYGNTDLPSGGFQDGVVSFGDTDFDILNEDTRQIYVSTSGPAWMWMNNAQAYFEYNNIGRIGNYLFVWNADYTQARIWMTTHESGRNWFGIGPNLAAAAVLFIQYYIELLPKPPSGACPPPANATKDQRTACATWVRTSCVFWCFGSWFGINKPLHYYVYQVVDPKGRKIEPYYTAMVDFMTSRANPDPAAAKDNDIDLGTVGLKNGTVLHGTYTK